MANDHLREAIERALPICPQCVERLDVTGATLCMACFHNSMARLNVHAAVAPLLAAERERREIATDELRRAATWVDCLAAQAERQSESMRGRFDHLADEAARDAKSHRATAASMRAALAASDGEDAP